MDYLDQCLSTTGSYWSATPLPGHDGSSAPYTLPDLDGSSAPYTLPDLDGSSAPYTLPDLDEDVPEEFSMSYGCLLGNTPLSLEDSLNRIGFLSQYVQSTLGLGGDVVCLEESMLVPRAARDVFAALGQVAHGGPGGSVMVLPFCATTRSGLSTAFEPTSGIQIFQATCASQLDGLPKRIIMKPIVITSSGVMAWMCVFSDMAYPVSSVKTTALFGTVLDDDISQIQQHQTPKKWMLCGADSPLVPYCVASSRMATNNILYRMATRVLGSYLTADTVMNFFTHNYVPPPMPTSL